MMQRTNEYLKGYEENEIVIVAEQSKIGKYKELRRYLDIKAKDMVDVEIFLNNSPKNLEDLKNEIYNGYNYLEQSIYHCVLNARYDRVLAVQLTTVSEEYSDKSFRDIKTDIKVLARINYNEIENRLEFTHPSIVDKEYIDLYYLPNRKHFTD